MLARPCLRCLPPYAPGTIVESRGNALPGQPGLPASEKAGYPKLMRDCKRAMSAENANEGAAHEDERRRRVWWLAGMILAAVSVAFAAFFQGFESIRPGGSVRRGFHRYERRAVEDRGLPRRRSEPGG